MAKGFLQLEDNTILEGELAGFVGESTGEVVFSTGMTGYPQSMTDPSFAGQILVLTYPLIGNYGVPKEEILQPHLLANFESEKIWTQAIILSSLCAVPSHYQSTKTFAKWCHSQKVPILIGIDTRALTIKLREHGTMRGKITLTKTPVNWNETQKPFDYHQVSIAQVVEYRPQKANGKHIALIDCGVKHGIIRALLDFGYKITRVPYSVNPLDVHAKYDGVVVSNGPGDPKDWLDTVQIIRTILAKKIPFVGVCLGHQLLALAIGADTYKLKYGHRGLNQPCQDIETKKCYLTSQNHGYAVETNSIPKTFTSWFVNLNDGTNEGIKNERAKIWTSQFHPEGNPGPFDSLFIFRKFLEV